VLRPISDYTDYTRTAADKVVGDVIDHQ
jgi:hypothetical protein